MTSSQITASHSVLTTAYYEYAKGMNAYSFFKVHNWTTSEDLVQDTFIKTWNYIAKGGKVETMKAFLYHILNQRIIDEYRRHKPVSLNVLVENGYEPSVDYADQFVDVFDGKVAMSLIKDLPLKHQKVMDLRYGKGLSVKEISAVVGQSKNTVAVQAHRGLEQLKVLHNHTHICSGLSS